MTGVRLSLLGLLLLVACGDPSTVATGDDGKQAVSYGGLIFEVPEDWVVQDVDGRLDGELACPDAPGFVFAGYPVSPDAVYTTATCDPPGEEVLVSLQLRREIDPGVGQRPTEKQGAFEFVRVSEFQVEFVDPPVQVFVLGPSRERVLAAIMSTVRAAGPNDDELTPTTAAAQTHVGERLADELTCTNRERASTYFRGGPGFVGRQSEAPLDCYLGEAGFRILVLRYDDAVNEAIEYYRGAWLIVDRDERTVVTALDKTSARLAHERLGGELLPPPDGCCGPPTSDLLPGMEQLN